MIYKTVSLAESQVGKYIDTNGDGIPEGIIFADLAIGGSGQWGEDNDKYHIHVIKGEFKEYVISGTYNHPINDNKEVLTPILDGIDRFYVMDIKKPLLRQSYLYKNAKNIDLFTDTVFGSGKENTNFLYQSWKEEKYGKKSTLDVWKVVKEEIEEGWFIPSLEEWLAFLTQINVLKNYENGVLEHFYWTSSQNRDDYLDNCSMFVPVMNNPMIVEEKMNEEALPFRLARTI